MQIIERPYNISFSLNHIRYVFQLDPEATGVPAGSFGQLQVKILFASSSAEPWQELATYLLQPAPDSKIFLYIQDLLNSRLNYVLPSFSEGVYSTHAAEQYGIYTIHYRLIQDGTTPRDYITAEQGYTQFVIKGGIEKQLHSRNNFFKYWEANNFFLTWQPSNRFIDPNQAAYLTFLNPNYNAPDLDQNFILCYRVADINGNFEQIQGPITQQGLIIHLYLKLKYSLATSLSLDQLYSLEIGVIKEGEPLNYQYKFYFEFRPLYNFYELVYFNSLGGVDSIRVRGDITETIERTTTEAFGGINVNEPFARVREHENFYSGILLQKHYKGDLGYLRSKELQYSFTDLLTSPGIYMRSSMRWVPVLNMQKSQDLGTRRDSLNKFPIEWELSEQNEVYTPDITLALGDNSRLAPPVCANVTGLSADIRTDASGSNYIHFGFTPVNKVKSYTASLVNKQYNFVEETLSLTWDLTTKPLEGSFPASVPPTLYSLVITTICNPDPLNVSSGASVDIDLPAPAEEPPPPPPAFCPVVNQYSFSQSTGTSIVATVTMQDIVSSYPKVQSVTIVLYNSSDQAINSATVYADSPYHIFSNLQPGSYYGKIQTNCSDGQSQVITTNTVLLSPAYLISAAATDSHTVMLYCTDGAGGVQVQMPFNATVQLDITYSVSGVEQHTTITTNFQAGLSQAMGYANYNATIVQYAITGLTPRTQNGITINF